MNLKKTLSFYSFLFLIPIVNVSAKEPEVLGKLKFAERKIEFGEVLQGTQLKHRFLFVNESLEDVKIVAVHAGCGCTVANWDENLIYGPGERGFVEVHFDTKKFEGFVRKTVIVLTSESMAPDRVLTLTAEVQSQFKVSPPVVDFGKIISSDEANIEVLVTAVKKEHQVKSAIYDKKFFDLVLDKTPEGLTKVYISLKKPYRSGILKKNVILATNSPALPKIVLPVRGFIQGRVGLKPDYVEFGVVKKNKEKTRSVILVGGKEVNILATKVELQVNGEKLRSPPEVLGIKINPKHAQGKKLILTLKNLPTLSGSIYGRVLLTTDDPSQKEITLDLYAYFR